MIAVAFYESMEFEVTHVPYEQRRDRLQKLLSARSQFIFDFLNYARRIFWRAMRPGKPIIKANRAGTVEDWAKVFTPDTILDYTQAGPAFGEKCSYQQLAEIMRGAAERPGLMSGSFHKWQHMLGLPLVEIGATLPEHEPIFSRRIRVARMLALHGTFLMVASFMTTWSEPIKVGEFDIAGSRCITSRSSKRYNQGKN
jgi:hypothetical protein